MSMTKEEVIRIRNTGCGNDWPRVWNRQLNELCDVYLKSLEPAAPDAAGGMVEEPEPRVWTQYGMMLESDVNRGGGDKSAKGDWIPKDAHSRIVAGLQARVEAAKAERIAETARLLDMEKRALAAERDCSTALSRLAAAERDGERYRWLREKQGTPQVIANNWDGPPEYYFYITVRQRSRQALTLDTAIDTALAASAKGEA